MGHPTPVGRVRAFCSGAEKTGGSGGLGGGGAVQDCLAPSASATHKLCDPLAAVSSFIIIDDNNNR